MGSRWRTLLCLIVVCFNAYEVSSGLDALQELRQVLEGAGPASRLAGACGTLQAAYRSSASSAGLVTELPQHMIGDFTMNGDAALEYLLVDDSNDGEGFSFSYDTDMFEKYAVRLLESDGPVGTAAEMNLAKALREFSHLLRNKSAVVFGSGEPIVEALLLQLGVKSVSVYDYHSLKFSGWL